MSSKLYSRALHIFRRDMRLQDNTALLAALENSNEVVPCFIFDPRQVGDKNPYKSDRAVQFMIESLQELNRMLHEKKSRLLCCYGVAEEVVEEIIPDLDIDAVFFNKDYTPFSKYRDSAIADACRQHEIPCHTYNDLILSDPDAIETSSGERYQVYTPFYKKASQRPVRKPRRNMFDNYVYWSVSPSCTTIDIEDELTPRGRILTKYDENVLVHGGRSESQTILWNLDRLENYSETRKDLTQQTSHLSAYNKFGTSSIREVLYRALKIFGPDSSFAQELYWRDFYTYLLYHYPHALKDDFDQTYANVAWSHNKDAFQRWCNGTTGFPIVDAGMRQLNATGYMHNRARMIVASFLTKDLHIDWRWGERYFAQKLVDYDVAVNNGSWQWAASTGADAQPYFRIFNPWRQQERFDKECIYIKQWVKELNDISPERIHGWHDEKAREIPNYPRPIVDHKAAAQEAKRMFKDARS